MSDNSPNLGLPFLLASQAQKHVTINESINRLDALVMLSVKQSMINAPPQTPIEGTRYIIGDSPTGAWAQKPRQIAAYQNLGWVFIEPQNGFIAYCEDDNLFLRFNNQNWEALAASIGDIQSAKLFGLGTSADANNPFALKANNALFSAKYDSENGNGDIIFKLNKESQNKKAGFLFQNNWSGRAEFGLIGNDDFTLKMSSDGTNFLTAFTVKPDGKIGIGAGATAPDKKFVVDSDVLFNNIALGKGLNQENSSTGIGYLCLNNTTSAQANTAIGYGAGLNLTSGSYNLIAGSSCGQNISSGSNNTLLGSFAGASLIDGSDNIALGYASSFLNTNGTRNIAIGSSALYSAVQSYNVAIGTFALSSCTIGSQNTALGDIALNNLVNYNNCTGIGFNAQVTGSNQIQLGDSATTTYVYGAVQSRSDLRDKTSIRETILGLDFINRLRPVDYKWDYRDDYREKPISVEMIEPPNLPNNFSELDENSQKLAKIKYEKDSLAYEKKLKRQENANLKIQERNMLKHILKDGSKTRGRYHSGLIAQEVKEVLDEMGIDWAAYQDHSLSGGDDVKSLGYTQFIGPIIKAIQELNAKIDALNQQN